MSVVQQLGPAPLKLQASFTTEINMYRESYQIKRVEFFFAAFSFAYCCSHVLMKEFNEIKVKTFFKCRSRMKNSHWSIIKNRLTFSLTCFMSTILSRNIQKKTNFQPTSVLTTCQFLGPFNVRLESFIDWIAWMSKCEIFSVGSIDQRQFYGEIDK